MLAIYINNTFLASDAYLKSSAQTVHRDYDAILKTITRLTDEQETQLQKGFLPVPLSQVPAI